jgi:hypothetical protein
MDSEREDFLEYISRTSSEITRDFFRAVRHDLKFDWAPKKIRPTMYKKALDEFMLYGKLLRFPEKHVFKWKRYVIDNTILLDCITDICGHSPCFPFDEFNDEFEVDTCDFVVAWEILSKKGDNLLPKWSNGHYLISDYALKPLWKLVEELYTEQDPCKILVLINKCLDIWHQRSDFAELFIDGGSKTLLSISN